MVYWMTTGKAVVQLRPIPDYSRYAAGADGHLYSWLSGSGRWRKLRGNADGTALLIRGDGKRVMTSVAKQVLRAWHGPAPIGHEPLHYPDHDPRNNRPDNLRWAPKGASKVGDPRLSEASRRKRVAGRAFDDDDVAEILRMSMAGISAVEIAESYGVGRRPIDQILSGRSYLHVPRPEGYVTSRRRDKRGADHPKAVLTPGKVRKIRRLKAQGMSGRGVARELGLNWTTVRRVLNGTAWREVT